MGKPIPKAQVMRFLKSKEYTDAKDFAGECESVVVVAKGQSEHRQTTACLLAVSSLNRVLIDRVLILQVCRGHASTGHAWTTYLLPPIHRTGSCQGRIPCCLPKEPRTIT